MLTELAPYRETAHRLLMEALERRGNLAEALRAYERLRTLLREELGAKPSPAMQAVHRRLLGADR
jgi:DNA-binding SARP family transcriptional activator